MKILKYKIFIILFGCFAFQNVNAASINIGFDQVGTPTVDLIGVTNGTVLDSALITDWALSYDDVSGSGLFSMSANAAKIGAVNVNSQIFTTNTNGSLHVEGLVTLASDASALAYFIGDLAVTVDVNDVDNTTIFNVSPVSLFGPTQTGLELFDVNGGGGNSAIGAVMDFNISSSFLAIVDSPFPIYSPVPVPAAFWLFSSGLIGLIAMERKKLHIG